MSTVPRTLSLMEHRPGERDGGERLAELTRRLHQSLVPDFVARAAVDDGHVWTGWDRVSLLLRRGRSWRLLAVTGQAILAPRSATSTRLERLVGQAQVGDRAWSWDARDPRELTDVEQNLLADYLAVSPANAIQIHPLISPDQDKDARKNSPRERRSGRPFAVLVMEDQGSSRADDQLTFRTATLVSETSAAMANALAHDRIFLRPMFRALGEAWDALTLWRGVRIAVMLLLIAAAISALFLTPGQLEIDATGRLIPVRQARLFSPATAEVAELLVASGQRVDAEQPVLRLRDEKLSEELIVTQNRIAEAQQALHGTKAELHEASRAQVDRAEMTRLQTRSTQLQIEIQGLKKQQEMLELAAARLIVTAPFSGIVTSPDLRNRLDQRPVQRGELLLEIAEDQGPWQLELLIPEQEFGKFQRSEVATDPQSASLQFRFVANPELVHTARVSQLGARTLVVSELGPCIAVAAELPDGLLADPRIGADVEARIRGPAVRLWDVLFGDFLAALYRASWW